MAVRWIGPACLDVRTTTKARPWKSLRRSPWYRSPSWPSPLPIAAICTRPATIGKSKLNFVNSIVLSTQCRRTRQKKGQQRDKATADFQAMGILRCDECLDDFVICQASAFVDKSLADRQAYWLEKVLAEEHERDKRRDSYSPRKLLQPSQTQRNVMKGPKRFRHDMSREPRFSSGLQRLCDADHRLHAAFDIVVGGCPRAD